jgi:hypothetical protein
MSKLSQTSLDTIVLYLNQHLSGMRGIMQQEPYKGDFFNLFKSCYLNQEIQPSDAFRDVVFQKLNGEELKKEEIMDSFAVMWDEWKYSIDNGLQKNFINLS